MLNVPERMHTLGAFHVEQFRTRAGIAILQFFDGTPFEPQTTTTADASLHFNAGDFHRLKFIVT